MKSFDITQACPATDELTLLLDTSFGPGRLARTAERLRESNRAVEAYGFCARSPDGALLGAISYWPIIIGEDGDDVVGLLLGPLAVHPDMQGQGVGQALMRASLQVVDADRFAFVLLVGDLPYYEKAGFMTAPEAVIMPGPVDPKRLLVRPSDNRHATLCSALTGKVRPAPEMC
jgi:predicted N-acetyltransferase YhbS